MPSDYGDEAGGKLLDWMMRIGQEAGEAAMARSAESLMGAIRNTKTAIERVQAEPAEEGKPGYAKLDLSEFQALPEYESVKEAISRALESDAVEHGFSNEAGTDFLVFRVEDAPEVDESLGKIGASAKKADARALGQEAPEAERLSEKAEAAREAAQAYNSARTQGKEIERAMQRAR